jgi:protein TonB
MGASGTVVLQAIISKAGIVEHLKTISGDPRLASAAIGAVKNWRYRPYLLNNQPVEFETIVSVTFQ